MDFNRINTEEIPQALRLSQILMKKYNPKSVVDYGCASGLYLLPFLGQGVNVKGIEFSEDAIKDGTRLIPREDIILEDLTYPMYDFAQPFDLALCLEVVEHIDPKFEEIVIDNITKGSKLLIFSGAVPGQGGDGHINCQPKEHWEELFKKHGFLRDLEDESDIIKELRNGYHMGWLANNLMVLKNEN